VVVPEPGKEPTLEECAADIERERLFKIIEDLVKWENTTNEKVLQRARAEIWQSCASAQTGFSATVINPQCYRRPIESAIPNMAGLLMKELIARGEKEDGAAAEMATAEPRLL
jgi:hypothetical protein